MTGRCRTILAVVITVVIGIAAAGWLIIAAPDQSAPDSGGTSPPTLPIYPTPAPVTFLPPTPLPTPSPTPDAVLNLPVPDVTLATLDGDPVRLRALAGDVIFLNFWATWCAPCREEMPVLQQLQAERGADGVRVIAVTDPADGQTEADIRAFVDEYALTLTVALASDRAIYDQFDTAQIPLTYVIDRAGTVRVRHVGPLHDQDIETYLRALEAE